MKAQNPIRLNRLILAMLLPLVAFALQSIFWAAIKPFAWFLFFPAVFFSSWIGGLPGGVIATLISTALAWWAFIPPEHSFALEDPFQLGSIALFMGMGFLFGYTQERVNKANRETAEALAVARSANEQLQGANEKITHYAAQLEAANKELEAFSYSVSHDLRAPLRAIDGFGQALLEDYANKLDDEGKDYLQRVRMGSQQMGQLIDDLLNLSRVSRKELSLATVDLGSLAQAIAAELKRSEPERQVEFVVAEGLFAKGDERLLRVALENLLGNAWKFTGKGSKARIEFGMTPTDGRQVFYVRDNGAGFDMAYADKLFGAFQRLHKSSEFAGSGIGLATVQRIIHRHGGRVWAEGAAGKGATFHFTLG